jgi:hypothetical protein
MHFFLLFSINYAAALIANSDMEGAVSAYLTALQYNPVDSIDDLFIFILNNYFLGFIWCSK